MMFDGKTLSHASGLTQRKRSFYSHYGYENLNGLLEFMLERTHLSRLDETANYDRFYLEGQVDWWKRQATKRYNKLKESEMRMYPSKLNLRHGILKQILT